MTAKRSRSESSIQESEDTLVVSTGESSRKQSKRQRTGDNSSQQFRVGDAVEARWAEDNEFYPATITSINTRSGKYTIKYDEDDVKEEKLLSEIRVPVPSPAEPVEPVAEVLQTTCQSILDALLAIKVKKRVISELFVDLPSREAYPDYYQVIKTPMAASKIQEKITKNKYTKLSQFEHDVLLMFKNAKTYNEEGSEVYEDAQTLENKFVELLAAADAPFAPAAAASSSKLTLKVTPPVKEKTEKKDKAPILATEEGKPSARLHLRIKPEKDAAKDVSDSESPEMAAIKETLDQIMAIRHEGREVIELFREKPSKEDFPEYYELIKRPISIREIQTKIKRDRFSDYESFEEDVSRMISNAKTFNEPYSEVYQDAERIQNVLASRSKDKDRIKALCEPQISGILKLSTPSLSVSSPSSVSTLRLPSLKLAVPSPPSSAPLSMTLPKPPQITTSAKKKKIAQDEIVVDEDDEISVGDALEEGRTEVDSVTLTSGQILETGRCVYIRASVGDRIMALVDKVFVVDQTKLYLFQGSVFFRPEQTFHLEQRRFYPHEIFKSSIRQTFSADDVIGFFYVVSAKDYARGRLEGVNEQDVWICDYRYIAQAKEFRRIRNWKSAFLDTVKTPVPAIIPFPEGPRDLQQIPSPFYKPKALLPIVSRSPSTTKFIAMKPPSSGTMITPPPPSLAPQPLTPQQQQQQQQQQLQQQQQQPFQLRALHQNGVAVHQRQMDAFINANHLLAAMLITPGRVEIIIDRLLRLALERGVRFDDWRVQTSPLLHGVWFAPVFLDRLLRDLQMLSQAEVEMLNSVFQPLFIYRPLHGAAKERGAYKKTSMLTPKSTVTRPYTPQEQLPPPPPPPPPMFDPKPDWSKPPVVTNAFVLKLGQPLIERVLVEVEDDRFSMLLTPHDDVSLQVDVAKQATLTFVVTRTLDCSGIRLLANGQLATPSPLRPRDSDKMFGYNEDEEDDEEDEEESINKKEWSRRTQRFTFMNPPPGTLVVEIEALAKKPIPPHVLYAWEKPRQKRSADVMTAELADTAASSSPMASSSASSSATATAHGLSRLPHRCVQTVFLQLTSFQL